jgi:AAA15 family ATPase/GTPase
MQNSVCLIDEIEVGIYYKKFPQLINVLDDLCKMYNVQLFLTTHSKDFIEQAKLFTDYAMYKLNPKLPNGYIRRDKQQLDELIADGDVDVR